MLKSWLKVIFFRNPMSPWWRCILNYSVLDPGFHNLCTRGSKPFNFMTLAARKPLGLNYTSISSLCVLLSHPLPPGVGRVGGALAQHSVPEWILQLLPRLHVKDPIVFWKMAGQPWCQPPRCSFLQTLHVLAGNSARSSTSSSSSSNSRSLFHRSVSVIIRTRRPWWCRNIRLMAGRMEAECHAGIGARLRAPQ